VNIEHVRSFLEVAATGSFHRAAARLHVTQSTVSARVQGLEQRIGQPLFSRGRSGTTLTTAGRRFHRYALATVRAWERGRQETALPEGFRASLALGTQVSLWERLVLKWIPWMRAALPDVALRLEADYSPSQMQKLADGLLDIGVMYMPRHMPGLSVETLLVETLVLVSTRPREAVPDWVADYVFVDWGDDFRNEHRRAFPEMETPAVSVGLGAMGLQHILAGGGSGYFPLRAVQPLLEDTRLHRVAKAPVFQRPAYMVYSADPSDPDLLDRALEGLRQVAREAADPETRYS
jgi:DNA-binding transcriptional LysR family regulator